MGVEDGALVLPPDVEDWSIPVIGVEVDWANDGVDEVKIEEADEEAVEDADGTDDVGTVVEVDEGRVEVGASFEVVDGMVGVAAAALVVGAVVVVLGSTTWNCGDRAKTTVVSETSRNAMNHVPIATLPPIPALCINCVGS